MNSILWVVATIVVLGLVWAWFHFIKAHALPPASEVREIAISFNENIGDLLPDDYESKEFELTTHEEISRVLEHLQGIPVSQIPLIDSDTMDEGPNWILNIYFKDGGFRFVTVDKEHVSGSAIKNSKLYQYLRDHYT